MIQFVAEKGEHPEWRKANAKNMIEFMQDSLLAVAMAQHPEIPADCEKIDDGMVCHLISYVLREQKVLNPGAVSAV